RGVVGTGVRDADAISRAFVQDASRYLRKPFTRDELVAVVEGALAESRADRRGDAKPKAIATDDGWVELTAPSRQEYVDRFQDFCDRLLSSRLDDKARNELKLAVHERA